MNNLFKYATKELSQDAFLCWSINWLNEASSHPLHPYGKAMLDLFLEDEKLECYYDVKVIRQYKKIDVLVLYKDINGNPHALIIEDKTNTSEHGDQMMRYKKNLEESQTDNMLKAYAGMTVHMAYVKTGIMYDEDCRITEKATVIDLNALMKVISKYAILNVSEILNDFYYYISEINNNRKCIEASIENGDFEHALKDSYGQFYFLDRIFSARTKNTVLGHKYINRENNPIVYIDQIYAGTNNGGTPWTQYCFRGDKYPNSISDEHKYEYHYLFWRIDCKWKKTDTDGKDNWEPYFYIALRHYDELAHSSDERLNDRKRNVYHTFRKLADDITKTYSQIFTEFGVRENYKESDLLFIPIENIKNLRFEEIKLLLSGITNDFRNIDLEEQ